MRFSQPARKEEREQCITEKSKYLLVTGTFISDATSKTPKRGGRTTLYSHPKQFSKVYTLIIVKP